MAISGKVAGAVGGVGVAGAVTTILMYLIKVTFGTDVPVPVSESVTTLLAAIAAGYGGWLMPHEAFGAGAGPAGGAGAGGPANPNQPGPHC